jgi:hypothetical protein
MLKNSNTKQTTEMSPIFLKLAPSDIVYLKAILESYDELGVLRTLDQKTGDVVILSLPDQRPELERLLASLANEISLTILDKAPGDQAPGDWLVDEGPVG